MTYPTVRTEPETHLCFDFAQPGRVSAAAHAGCRAWKATHVRRSVSIQGTARDRRPADVPAFRVSDWPGASDCDPSSTHLSIASRG
ncbi:hypothetical protein GCM10011380_22950 [Sphingomonas metalli]|uniref:Uncharacterized protein n=1 Tax=Sphingomonas metalli TaxID=1779358 RepID=A0A916T884_9SPHN|nr:hypothetical protein GCM10011380_22950 [Sphingomonas metalli]